jgi:hypothetical protein
LSTEITSAAGEEPKDTHFDYALDDEPEPTRAPVYVDAVVREHTKLPIIPASLRGRANIKTTVKRAAGRTGHRAAFHAVRVPILYLPLAVKWAVVGVFRVAGHQIKWWWVLEQHQLRQEAATKNDPDTWLKLHREARAARAWRGSVLLGEAVGLAVALVLLVFVAPWWIVAVTVVVTVPALAHYGRPADKRIVTPAVVTPRFRKLNPDIVLRAYYAASLGRPDKPDQKVDFAGTMARDRNNQGSQVLVDLPYGKTFSDVVKAKESIASGLDVTEFQVFLTRDKTSVRRHMLFVADRDPLAIPAGRTDMLDCKPRDIWKAARFGLDERGQRVTVLLMWQSFLVGAQPRKGKTFSARLLALYAALDPYVKLIIADGKNSPDWRKFTLVAHRMIFGTAPNRDGDPVERLIEALWEIRRHIEAVNETLSQLPVDVCPEGKLTRELARDPRYPLLRVWMLVMEEFQTYFELEDQDKNKEIAGLLAFILAVGPSAGVIVLSSSQKPSGVGAGDVQRLFNRYRDNHGVRFALKCGNRDVSNAILGSEAYGEGYDASALPTGLEYRGVGYLYGLTDETPTVRTHLADHLDAEKILLAARRHREAAGTLSGMAAGEDVAREARDVLADVVRVFAHLGRPAIQWQTLAAILAEEVPEAYAGSTPESVSALIRAEGVPSEDVKVEGVNLKGCKRTAVEAAIKRKSIRR